MSDQLQALEFQSAMLTLIQVYLLIEWNSVLTCLLMTDCNCQAQQTRHSSDCFRPCAGFLVFALMMHIIDFVCIATCASPSDSKRTEQRCRGRTLCAQCSHWRSALMILTSIAYVLLSSWPWFRSTCACCQECIACQCWTLPIWRRVLCCCWLHWRHLPASRSCSWALLRRFHALPHWRFDGIFGRFAFWTCPYALY